ncbi:MAG: pentapeptide repeat-containing protein [Nostoc sp. ChiSLP01]|nr:pentapeptide repeat-containing protein [Nostoc sp. CmiSLP01]MDZ8288415.1 pentapeptide repeat-containing protein [Nostoc sp. ChiSLP01]
MQLDEFRKGIVRILKPSGQTAGTGFFVSPQLVITCAHVVASSRNKPSTVVDLVLLKNRQKLTASIEERYWRAPEYEDVAILRVNEPFIESVPLKLGTSANIAGHEFFTYGFPESIPQGILVKGSIDGETGDASLLQLTSQEVTEGVSGAPVFDQQTRRVVGMITARAGLDLREVERKIKGKKETVTISTGRLEKTAFATPSHILKEICPELNIENICPYQGLLAFTEEDSRFFHGRDRLINKLIENLRRNPRFLAIVGSSGSGKSSVVQAGLLPKLRYDVSGFQNCKIVKFRPGNNPRQSLLSELVSIFPDLKDFAVDSNNFWTVIQQKLSQERQRTLIFVDQFEEIFVLPNPEEQEDFVKGLLSLLELSLTLILTIRSDFYEFLLQSGFGDCLEFGQFNILGISNEELKSAIIQPAKAVGLQIEAGLVELIIADLSKTTKNPLPLLEFTLTQLWEVGHINNCLTCNHYKQMGGVTGSLSQWADSTYYALNISEQHLAQKFFMRLIRYGLSSNVPYTRRRLMLSELVREHHNDFEIFNLVRKLASNRLVVTDVGEEVNTETIEIIHDALIQEWKLLQYWIKENQEKLLQRDKIELAAEEWETQGRSNDYLWQGKLLNSAKSFQKLCGKEFNLSKIAEAFIIISLSQRRKNRLKFIGIALVIPGISSVFLGIQTLNELRNRPYWDIVNSRSKNDPPYERRLINALQELNRANRSLANIDISNADLSKIDLRNADLRFANLQDVTLWEANLQNADLSGANLQEASLYANFYNANFHRAKLGGASFSRANLNQAYFVRADLSNAYLGYSDLRGASFGGAYFENADLSYANLTGVNLNNARLCSANLERATLAQASLREARFISANLNSADLKSADLFDADFRGADLKNADLRGVKGLTVEQIKASQNWQYATYDDEFHKKLVKIIPSQAEFDNRNVSQICQYPS